tara:strand:- start:697 stop:1560 length:864 start_codon:yes stop_codon:yes gene_type:complete
MLENIKKLIFFLKKNKEIYLIESNQDEGFLIDSLKDEKYIGLDTEFSWRKTYFPELSILQISTESKIFLIDCLKFKKFDLLNKILEKKDKLIVMHSSRSDTTVLSTNLKIKIKNIFDIQIAEKYIYGGEIKNYGAIVLNHFGHKLDKSETNSNWLKRPLDSNQLEYAADDVNFLIPIYKAQLKKLKKTDKLDIVFSESRREAALGNQELHVSRIKKLKKATKDERAIFLWREKQASKKNLPPSFIFEDRSLKKIAKEIKIKDLNSNILAKLFKDFSSVDDFLKNIKL